MIFRIKLIESDQERQYFVEVLAQGSKPDARQTPRVKVRRELIAKLVEDYDLQQSMKNCADPVDAILQRMTKLGMRQKDLAPILGGKNRASEVLARRRPLTLPMIRKLNQLLKIPPELLIGEIQLLLHAPKGASRREPTTPPKATGRFRGRD